MLAERLADRFAALAEVRPRRPRATRSDGALVFSFEWPLTPGDEHLLATGHKDDVMALRRGFLGALMRSLAELVELDLGRAVTASDPELGDDPSDARAWFTLGGRREPRRPREELARRS